MAATVRVVLQQRRHTEIVRLLRDEGPVGVRVIAEQLGVSPATVRRDLVRLDSMGLLTRVRGGALARPDAPEPPFSDVAAAASDSKKALVRRAARLVRDDEVVLLDIGTTTALLARELRGRRVTVVTSSLAVVEELLPDPVVEIVVLGGAVRRNYRSLVGFLTEDALRQVHADRLFLGTSGVRPGGQVMDSTAVEVPLKRAMIRASEQVVLLADEGKLPGSGFARVCDASDIDVLVTNHDADGATLDTMREAGVEVLTA